MNPQIDSLTETEMMEYYAHHEPRRFHTTGCDGCDDEQRRTGNRTALCKSCQRDIEINEGLR